MALNPLIVTKDVTVTWDGVSQRIPRGTLLDTPSAGALFAAIGGGNLTAGPSSDAAGVSVGPFLENLTGGGQEPFHYQS